MSNIDRELKTRCAAVIANSKALEKSLEALNIRNDRVMLKAVDAIDRSMAAIGASFKLADKLAEIPELSKISDYRTRKVVPIAEMGHIALTK